MNYSYMTCDMCGYTSNVTLGSGCGGCSIMPWQPTIETAHNVPEHEKDLYTPPPPDKTPESMDEAMALITYHKTQAKQSEHRALKYKDQRDEWKKNYYSVAEGLGAHKVSELHNYAASIKVKKLIGKYNKWFEARKTLRDATPEGTMPSKASLSQRKRRSDEKGAEVLKEMMLALTGQDVPNFEG